MDKDEEDEKEKEEEERLLADPLGRVNYIPTLQSATL
jgi:hypothetical protein